MNRNTKEKICAFYASDYHFEMISLPYINKKMENKEDIIILTENNLEETLKTLLAKINLKEEKKKNILSLDWQNNDLKKLDTIKREKEKNLTIFIKGKENYIKNINKKIEQWTDKEENIKIIDCYDIEEVGENLEKIMEKYQKILRTTGEKKIENL